MANEEHLKILKQRAEAWNKWREENPKVRPDFEGANLGVADLMEANLKGANLWRANLQEANLKGTNLEDAYLFGAILYKANMQGANLHNTNLNNANLDSADLKGAYIQGAKFDRAFLWHTNLQDSNLRGAILHDAILEKADLQGADLTGAYIQGAILQDTNLDGASLDDAIFDNTIITNVDLGSVKGLKTIKHKGPSSIGIDTISQSEGKIPDVFLRGCGVPEKFITYMSSLVDRAIEFYSCFISYSHDDKAFARRLYDSLQGKGIRCWLDEHELRPGDNILREIDRGIRIWDKVLLCCSKDSLTSWWVNKELDKAIQKEATLSKKYGKETLALIPVDLDGYVFEGWESEKESFIKNRFIADFTGWKDHEAFEKQFEKIVDTLKTEDARMPPPEPKL